MITALSSAGIGFILFRVVGYSEDQARKLKRPGLLIVSTVLFCLAVLFGFLIASSITGFWNGVIAGKTTALEYLTEDNTYSVAATLSAIQIISAGIGTLLVAIHVWYSTRLRRKCT